MRIFHKLGIGAKLSTAFGALTLLTALVGVFCMIRISAINTTAHNLAFRVAPSVQFTSAMRTDMGGYRRSQLAHILSIDETGYSKYEQLLKQYNGDLRQQENAYQPLIDSPEEQRLLADFDREWDVYLSMNDKVITASRQHEVSNAAQLVQGETRLQYARAENVLSELIALKTQQALQASEEENRVYTNSKRWTWLVLLASVGLSLALKRFFSKLILEPLQQFMAVASNIGESGDLEHDIDITRQDEIGELARSFSRMVSYLNEMAAISNAIAAGDLGNEVRPRSKHDKLGHAFAGMTEGLSTLVHGVRDSAAQVATGSSQVAESSDESAKVGVRAASAIEEVTSTMHEMSVNVQNIARNTQLQASCVSETSASIDQMATSIWRIADTSKVLLEISTHSRQEVENGIGSMQKASDGLNRINLSILSAAETIDVLGHCADDIGNIIGVIDDLADQTNLLALNAAIEAARAGEHGLGFAVVADEVRKLAEKSAESTKEVSGLIQRIQKEARKAVNDMETSTNIVNDGLSLGADLGAALKKISDVVAEVHKFATDIGAATNEQSKGSSQIAHETNRLNALTLEINCTVNEQASGTQAVLKSMERMRELVQQNSSGATQLAAAAEQMSTMSRGLLNLMDRFKLEAENAPMRELPQRRAARLGDSYERVFAVPGKVQ